jgi:adenylate cyclase
MRPEEVQGRRLAAIVFTDIVGYTMLAQRDEALAIRLLDTHNSLVRSVLKHHTGREVKTMGDAFLLEFDSALDAVMFAVEVQTSFKDHNSASPDDQIVHVRIGIHVGDVVHRGSDVLGDAVNIASRIVDFAEGGGICISGQVHDQVRNKLQYPMEKMPEQRLKNVELGMDLYRVLLPWPSASPAVSKPPNRIAVMPFENISPDPSDSYFADGLTEELISALSEVRGLRVIARTSVNRFRNSSKSVKQIGNELRVSHLLEGSVRKAGNRIRITAHLVDAESQEEVWSDRYEKNLDDVLSVQSDIAASVVDSLKVRLLSAEKERIQKRGTENIAAYVAYLKGRALLSKGTEKDAKEAREQFELAIREDEGYARAYSGLADTHVILGDYLFAPVPVALEEAGKCVKEALALDPGLAEARVSLANVLMYDWKFEEASRQFRKAIEANPSYASGHHWYSTCISTFGQLKEALAEVLTAEELDPLSSSITLTVIYRLIVFGMDTEIEKRIRKLEEIDPDSPLVNEAKMAYRFAKKDWKTAGAHLKRMMERDPGDPYLMMDAAYIDAVTGNQKEAIRTVRKLEEVPEGARIKGQLIAFVYVGLGDLDKAFEWLNYAASAKEGFISWVRGYPLFEPVRRDPRFNELLRKAGLPLL